MSRSGPPVTGRAARRGTAQAPAPPRRARASGARLGASGVPARRSSNVARLQVLQSLWGLRVQYLTLQTPSSVPRTQDATRPVVVGEDSLKVLRFVVVVALAGILAAALLVAGAPRAPPRRVLSPAIRLSTRGVSQHPRPSTTLSPWPEPWAITATFTRVWRSSARSSLRPVVPARRRSPRAGRASALRPSPSCPVARCTGRSRVVHTP